MAQTVYVLGAGTNMVVRHRTRGVRPPLARDFFRQLHDGLNITEATELRTRNRETYEYIERNWGLGYNDLSTKFFDLEECFTRLEQEERDASASGEVAGAYNDVWKIKGQLTSLLAELLDEISTNQPPGRNRGLGPLARRVLEEEAAVVTFNYDTLLEQAMILESHRQWNPTPAYSTPFNCIQPHGWESLKDFQPAAFVAQAHAAPFLKMHGSLNWFRIVGGGDPVQYAPGLWVGRHPRLEETIVRPVGTPTVTPTTGHTFYMPDGTLLEQLIITPVIHKEFSQSPFPQVWQRAKDELSSCTRLVVCGYSFPRTDVATYDLLRESFANGPPTELIVINPDSEVTESVKRLCGSKGCVRTFTDLKEYMGN